MRTFVLTYKEVPMETMPDRTEGGFVPYGALAFFGALHFAYCTYLAG